MKKNRIFHLLFFFLAISGCKEEGFNPETPFQQKGGVFICNEGNFTYGNASLSFYDPDTQQASNQVFSTVNDFPLGDVAQSMTILDSLGFIVINNSGKIFVINVHDFSHVATIAGLVSPRYYQAISASKAYISDIYSGYITIVDPTTFDITGYIEVSHSTENMIVYNDFVFVTSWFRNNKVYKIDTRLDEVTDSIQVSKQPNSIVMDNQEKLWVLCDGGYVGMSGGKDSAALYRIEPTDLKIEQKLTFSVLEISPSELKINGNGDTLFYISNGWEGSTNGQTNGIYRMLVSDLKLPSSPFIPEGKHLYYGMGIDPVSSDIYVSDAVDYQQHGWVFRYSSEGISIDSFKVGIIPSDFTFKY